MNQTSNPHPSFELHKKPKKVIPSINHKINENSINKWDNKLSFPGPQPMHTAKIK